MSRFPQDLYSQQLSGVTRPSAHAIGKGADGAFLTAAHKEYPPRFCQAIAFSIISQLQRDHEKGGVQERTFDTAIDSLQELKARLQEITRASSCIRAGASWLPDFQGWDIAA